MIPIPLSVGGTRKQIAKNEVGKGKTVTFQERRRRHYLNPSDKG